MSATSEAAKEYMLNAISVTIRGNQMKLGEDDGLEARNKINWF